MDNCELSWCLRKTYISQAKTVLFRFESTACGLGLDTS